MQTLPKFETPDLARVIEGLPAEELDCLPFGVIGLDANDRVRVYNKAEAEQSGYGDRSIKGSLFFQDIAPCMNGAEFKDRIDKARLAGTLNISFRFVGDFQDREREFSVRVQAARDGGCWIFHQRS